MLNFNAEGRLIGIEVLDVRERVSALTHGIGINPAAAE
jgi:hypothetical protein